MKNSAPGYVRGRPYLAPMRFDDRAADRKSHAHAARFGRVEWIEEAVEILRLQSGARISHFNVDAVRWILRSADHQLARPLGDVAHRFGCVDNQIEDYLL